MEPYDVVVIGAGHNGLVAGFYLARAGLRTVILERREIVGGACNTEEFAPGFRASTGAYVLSMLRPAIWRDMHLTRRGIRVDVAGPTMNLYPDGATYQLGDDMASNIEETKRFSPSDAMSLGRFDADLAALARGLRPAFDWPPPNVQPRSWRDFWELVRWGRLGFRHRRLAADLAYLFSTSADQYLSEYFSSEHVKAALGWHAINDSLAGPSTPGTAFVLVHDYASEGDEGGAREWGFVRGGMGRLTEAMAEAAREAGCDIRLDAEVERILVAGGSAVGVALQGGDEILSRQVVSNADPKRTFLRLCDGSDLPQEFLARVRAYRCIGTSIKINLGIEGLPSLGGKADGVIEPHHTGIMELNPFIADMDAHQAMAVQGLAADPAHIELCIPTVHDATLAPPGHHIITIDVNSQPYKLHGQDWDSIKESRADRAIATIAEHFPTLPAMIRHRQILTPLDLERRLALTGGHALHGDMAPDQLLFLRPVRGWADYRTPIQHLYLCGAGTHPGGGVSGANGRNAAREILRTVRRGRGSPPVA